jgi:hypothetical protein
MTWKSATVGTLIVCATGLSTLVAQEPRPANVPFYTWVREDTFAGFMDDDMTRFERGVQKAQAYLEDDPTRADAINWLGATKVYRAVRAFRAGDSGAGEALLDDAMKTMDEAVSRSPNDVGIRATAGGTLVLFASQLPAQHHRAVMHKAREHYAALYELQSPALAHLPLHVKGELLAGVAETELRVGDREKATSVLNTIVKELPGTAYARTAEAWLSAPDRVTRESKLACQSCHEAGRLQSWLARQK